MKLPKQISSGYIGAFLHLANEVAIFITLFNFVMVSRIQYYNSDDSVIRSVFPNYSSFFIGCCLVGLGGMLVAYVVITPSKQKFFQKQSVMDGRNPIYEKLLDIEKQIEELKKNN